MAAITLALLSVFAYLHMRAPQEDLRTAYERAFMGENLPIHQLVSEQQNITDANILSAIANQEVWQNANYELK